MRRQGFIVIFVIMSLAACTSVSAPASPTVPTSASRPTAHVSAASLAPSSTPLPTSILTPTPTPAATPIGIPEPTEAPSITATTKPTATLTPEKQVKRVLIYKKVTTYDQNGAPNGVLLANNYRTILGYIPNWQGEEWFKVSGNVWVKLADLETSADIQMASLIDFVPELAAPIPSKSEATAQKNINLRSGPGVNYDRIGVLSNGHTAEITGQIKVGDGYTWYQLSDSSWVRGDLVHVTNLDQIPIVADSEIPPTPTPRPVTPTTTPIPFSSITHSIEWDNALENNEAERSLWSIGDIRSYSIVMGDGQIGDKIYSNVGQMYVARIVSAENTVGSGDGIHYIGVVVDNGCNNTIHVSVSTEPRNHFNLKMLGYGKLIDGHLNYIKIVGGQYSLEDFVPGSVIAFDTFPIDSVKDQRWRNCEYTFFSPSVVVPIDSP